MAVLDMAGVTDGFWFLNPMFPTVTQLIVVDVVVILRIKYTVGKHPIWAGA